MTRRILQIIPTLVRGGAEKQCVLLATNLPRDEFDVHVCALSGAGPLADELKQAGVPLTVVGKRWKVDPLAWWQLRSHIRRLNPDLVQTWLFAGNAYGRAAAWQAGTGKVVASERCVDSWKSGYQLAIDRRLARRTDAIVVNSRGVERFYRQQGIAGDKLRLIYNGIAAAPPSTISHDALCAELGLPAGVHLIGAVGRLWHQKRIKDLIWAADLLKVIRDDTHLLLIGDGPLRDDLEHFRDKCVIADKVHFLGIRDDVMRLMPHFDLLWLASSFEGLPNVVMEAMSAAVPVVATDIEGTRELVEHGQTGFLVSVGDRAALARYAHKILEDRELRDRLGQAGRDRVLHDFSVEKMVGAHAALYRELLG
ncbi:MAG: glycosyltransferase [Planctomycetota bacterium]|mgnify:CR=1 FL=1|nr:MAG: glycosyltransferase [Planctomycetota bacterium]